MTKIEFYSLHGYNDSNVVKVKCEGYTDGKYQYYKLGSVWFAIVPGYGASIAEGKTRKEAQAKAHEKTEALEKILETNGEKLRERFLDAPTQEEIEHNARVAEEQPAGTEVVEETAEETNEPTTEPEEEKENETMTTTYNITYNAQFDSHEVTFESKPATVKPTTPDDEPTKPAKGEPKEEPAAEETASVQPAEQAHEPENALDIAYTANLRRVYENTLSRMANNEYYGFETENGIKTALEYLEAMPEILTEDQINHAMRLAMCRRNSPDQPTPEAEPAETITESAGEIPEEVPETAGFHPIINNLPKKSKWDVWNVHPDEYLSSCVVPLVRCDENYHVLDTVYLKVDTPEEVKTLMSAAAVGNRRRWPKYSKQYRRETVQRAADIIEKYYI